MVKSFIENNHLSSSSNSYIDDIYQKYQKEPNSVELSWRHFFEGFEFSKENSSINSFDNLQAEKEFNVFRLIQSYRSRGHLLSDTNPIRMRVDRDAKLDLANYDLSEDDLKNQFNISRALGLKNSTLQEIIDHLQTIYCKHIGIEYMHITDTNIRRWVRENYEQKANNFDHEIDKKKIILKKLNDAVVFENFLQNKFIGQKRFSLEGGESTIPALNAIIEEGSKLGAKEFVFGMAHRGRLNVLANIIGKTYEFIFDEFEGNKSSGESEDDVKYHLGYTSNQKTNAGKEVFLKIMHNPSHLEAVSVTTMGYVRAQKDLLYDDYNEIIPVVIHGDAAIAGQGIVYESAQMSKLDAYNVGGTIHFVINNQIGFTTDFIDARSSHYCTSVGKIIDAPILHVNGDNPEAVVFACEFATEFRQKFKQDIFIDMVCYRKYGHNEGDEPKYTQPHLYGLVAKHENPRDLYLKKLKSQDHKLQDLAKKMENDFKKELSDRFNNVKQKTIPQRKQGPHREWKNIGRSTPEDFDNSPKTSITQKLLEKITNATSSVPENFKPLKKASKILNDRKKRFEENRIDWALAEMYAFGSLLTEGTKIRFTGQDVIRGTFSHRHAKVFDEFTNTSYCGLNNISKNQAEIEIYNSLLSEYAVLGYEYGYSLGSPRSLNIWEAQFGDFANGAQIVIDQFISSCETKWKRMTGLVLLLPHGHEGQGPEHSSARVERFLQMAAQYNMVIANCTTPANLFHILRRQLAWNFRKPLILFTPKSLLRHPECISKVEDFTSGGFSEVIIDTEAKAKEINKVIFCTGKIYYDLSSKVKNDNIKDVAIVRVEQLYPFPENIIKKILLKYKHSQIRWVQEEPLNMGTFQYLQRFKILKNIKFFHRKESASPATGFAKVHQKEQLELITKALS